MALGDVIARLAVNLSLETVAFEKGATRSEKRMSQMRRKFSDFSKSIAVGAAAIGTAVVGINKVFSDLAQTSKEMGTAAQVAGETFENFQRQAYGARMVGIEVGKLGDIFKDVRDRIGDFTQTGGGPMADFFENIAPKVGVTAKAFEGLGGRDALQLYYDSLKKANVSQEDMVFYLETMASDATNLIPLLENGGAAWERYGQKAAVITEDQRAQLQRYEESMAKLDNSLQQLALTLVDSGLIDNFAKLAEQLSAVVEGFSGVEVAANATDEELKKTEGARTFGESLRTVSDTMQRFADEFDAMSARNAARAREFWSSVGATFVRFRDLIRALPDIVTTAMQRLYNGVRTWLQDKLGAVFDTVRKKVEMVEGAFHWLWDKVVGNSWVPDMVDGIAAEMARLDKVMVDPAAKAARKTSEIMRDMATEVRQLLDRLFPEIGVANRYRNDLALLEGSGLGASAKAEARRRLALESVGIDHSAPVDIKTKGGPLDGGIDKSLEDFSRTMDKWAKRSGEATVRVAKSFKDMATDTISALRRMTDAIRGGGFLDILEGIFGLGMQLGSIGVFGQKIADNINSSVPGYATGTRSAAPGLAWVGERGPELVNFRGGERVWSNRESMATGGGIMEIRPSPLFDVYVDGKLVQAAPAMMQGGAQLAGSEASFAQSRRIGG